jgi:hypothetical protein
VFGRRIRLDHECEGRHNLIPRCQLPLRLTGRATLEGRARETFPIRSDAILESYLG